MLRCDVEGHLSSSLVVDVHDEGDEGGSLEAGLAGEPGRPRVPQRGAGAREEVRLQRHGYEGGRVCVCVCVVCIYV